MALTRRSTRRGVAALTGLVLAGTLATGIASTTSATTPPGVSADGAPQETSQAARWTGGLSGQAPCPEGRSRSATLLHEGFNNGIPQERYNNGWTTVNSAIGGKAARSEVNSNDGEDFMFLNWAKAPVGAQTMLAFTTRGNVASSGYSRADVNSVSNQVAANVGSWRGKVFNITDATRDEQGRLGPWFQHRSRQGASQWWELDNVQIYTCRDAAVSRLQGDDRFATSAAIAGQYPAGVDVAYLASGTGFADALAGAALAAKNDGPVLLVEKNAIPSSVAGQLDRLNPKQIVILGGTGSVSESVATKAAGYTSGSVTRLAGEDRYGTSAAIANTYPTGISTLYVASGATYPDALSGGASAGRNARPLLLTAKDSLPAQTRAALERLDGGQIVILGGTGSVSTNVANQLKAYTDGPVTRIAGSDRYETSALIARTFPVNRDRVFVATGTSFPDALSGSALAGKEATAVVLSSPTNLSASARSAITRLGADSGVVLGGYNSVNSIVLDQLGRLVG